MKKTTRTLFLAFSSLLLLMAVTASASAQGTVVGTIKYKKDFGVAPAGPGSSNARVYPCDVFSVAALDSKTNKLVTYLDEIASPFKRADRGDYYVCQYAMKVPFNRSLYIIATMGGVLLLPQEDRNPMYITDAWIGGTRSKPSRGYERGFTGRSHVTVTARKRSAIVNFEMIYFDNRGPN